jgi:DNA topoisomerase III
VTAQLECLLDDVVVGKQEMVGAIDAVCDVAERIIGRLKESATTVGTSLHGDVVGNGAAAYPPTPAMKRFANRLTRKGIKPPPDYQTSISICRKFLSEHAPKRADGEAAGRLAKPPSPAQLLYATKIALGKGVAIPDEAKANSAAIAAWIDSNKGMKRRKSGRKTAFRPAASMAPKSTSPPTRSRRRRTQAGEATPARPNLETGTPLRIPYGNKEVAMKLGARYGSTGWYAPPGADLSAFGERGWL